LRVYRRLRQLKHPKLLDLDVDNEHQAELGHNGAGEAIPRATLLRKSVGRCVYDDERGRKSVVVLGGIRWT
jgi:hypothetical protein